jgi:hypothetical protein
MARPRKNCPSERDRAIYTSVRLLAHSQEAVGRQHGVTQGRVSQIVARVAAHYAREAPEMLGQADEAARRRLADEEYRLRLDMAFASAHAAFEDSARPLVTQRDKTTTTTKGGEATSCVKVEEKVERGQRRDTGAVREMRRVARERWELDAGARRAEPDRPASTAEPDSSRQEQPTWRDKLPQNIVWPEHADAHAAEDPFSNEAQKQMGADFAVSQLDEVCRGAKTLDQAEVYNVDSGRWQTCIPPSYYKKNADGISFTVADWVREQVPPERLPGPDHQPVMTVHDVANWKEWHHAGLEERNRLLADCQARREAWRARDGKRASVAECERASVAECERASVTECESMSVTECESASVAECERASVTGSTPSHSQTLAPSHAHTLAPPRAAPPRQSSRFEAILNSPRSKRMRPRQRRRLEALAARLRAARAASGLEMS